MTTCGLGMVHPLTERQSKHRTHGAAYAAPLRVGCAFAGEKRAGECDGERGHWGTYVIPACSATGRCTWRILSRIHRLTPGGASQSPPGPPAKIRGRILPAQTGRPCWSTKACLRRSSQNAQPPSAMLNHVALLLPFRSSIVVIHESNPIQSSIHALPVFLYRFCSR